jgi:hypothetical protein
MTETLYQTEHLQAWTRPRYYFGEEWHDWFVFLGQTRDSGCLTRSNFRVGYRRLEEATRAFNEEHEESGVQIAHETHFLCGWVEWIAIHKENTAALEAADRIAERLLDYPVVDEEDWSELESEEANEVWKTLSLSDRLELCRLSKEVSIFAARHDYIPQNDCGRIQESLLSH